ncbi:MAG TPA: type II secretion system protein [Tepidisphaeraceae bacterium]|nr:type II secretion system protein [Tepidisphaeraceae bacterium]
MANGTDLAKNCSDSKPCLAPGAAISTSVYSIQGRHMNKPISRHGFTIVELLIVIGIITLLISILMPSLRRAREAANSTACLSNLRQIGMAVGLYAIDNHGFMVPKDFSDPKNPSALPGNWAGILIDYKYLNAPEQVNYKSTTSEGNSVFRCPSGQDQRWNLITPTYVGGEYSQTGAFFWRQQSAISQKYYDIWYAVNADNQSFGVYPMNELPVPGINVSQLMKVSRIHHSEQVPLVYDGIEHHFGMGWGYTAINARHNFGKTTNILFVDGHCAGVDRRQLPSAYNEMSDVEIMREKYPSPQWRLDQ